MSLISLVIDEEYIPDPINLMPIPHVEMIRVGECNQCGLCCKPPTKERLQAYADAGLEVTTQHLSGCPFEARTEDGRLYCTDYDNRPDMCRIFPTVPVDIMTIPECGYSFMAVIKG